MRPQELATLVERRINRQLHDEGTPLRVKVSATRRAPVTFEVHAWQWTGKSWWPLASALAEHRNYTPTDEGLAATCRELAEELLDDNGLDDNPATAT